jgi:hypothetical protein
MKLILKFLVLIVLLTGCLGETHCPAYKASDLAWMPYKTGQKMLFTDGQDTMHFIIDEDSLSSAYSFKNNCLCYCEAQAYFCSSVDSVHLLKIEGYSYSTMFDVNYNYNFINCVYYNYELVDRYNDRFCFEYASNSWSVDSLPIYQGYSHVLKMQLDTIDNGGGVWRKPNIWEIYIAKSVGLIEFSSLKSKSTWRLIK